MMKISPTVPNKLLAAICLEISNTKMSMGMVLSMGMTKFHYHTAELLVSCMDSVSNSDIKNYP